MGDENLEIMNLDLNLGPTSPPDTVLASESLMSESLNLDEWIDEQQVYAERTRSRMEWIDEQQTYLERPRSRIEAQHAILVREEGRSRLRQRLSLGPLRVPFEARNIASEFMVNTANRDGDILQTGEGSASLDERRDEVAKECESGAAHVENEKLAKSEEPEKGSGDEGSFFDCNICLDVSSNPVLTCCGHLFCWPCLHQWLNVHSEAKECPVCKGEVSTKNLTPIYGHGSNTNDEDEKTSLKIPDRPQARRVESWRQMIRRNAFTIPMDDMIRRLGSGFYFSRDSVDVQPQNMERVTESPERNSSLLNQILTSRGMRQEQTTTTVPPEDIVDTDLTQNTRAGSEVDAMRFASYLRRSHTYRSAPTAELANITQRLIESYMRYTTAERSLEQPLPVDDRDSVSSIAAVIHSESQTLDTAVEIDSTVSLSTSSSQRRIDASRVSDVDSGDSRAPRRRRLN